MDTVVKALAHFVRAAATVSVCDVTSEFVKVCNTLNEIENGFTMAQKTIVTLVDDLTGEEAENISTVELALDGVTYELDPD